MKIIYRISDAGYIKEDSSIGRRAKQRSDNDRML